ncbi:hypothetical protein TNCV_2997061 [Trichonephila clavipes]|nr:hypothetical protein TNCV_2997061 [Trichonephila clavipes]
MHQQHSNALWKQFSEDFRTRLSWSTLMTLSSWGIPSKNIRGVLQKLQEANLKSKVHPSATCSGVKSPISGISFRRRCSNRPR